MAITPLSGSPQPPNLTETGKALPDQPVAARRVNESEQTAAQGATTQPVVLTEESNTIDIEDLNRKLESITSTTQRGLRFQVDDITGATVISVVDRSTDETIRQIPAEELLNLSRRLKEVSEDINSARGVLIQTDA
jgi:flagellar protein FlaG